MPECYVQPVTDRQVCFKCHKSVTGKKKLSKCSKCHAITYCGRECQVADWPRHAWNCIPVMVKEIPGKGRGLVAARDIKMGEFIFLEKPVISLKLPKEYTLGNAIRLSEEEFDSFLKQVKNLSSEAKLQFYKLEEKGGKGKIGGRETKEIRIFLTNNTIIDDRIELLLNKALINHSCAPNALAETIDHQDQKSEVRAIKDISKGEEVTIFYKFFDDYTYKKYGWKVNERKRLIKNILGFDCNCGVCSGIVPGQEDIIKELIDLHEELSKPFQDLTTLFKSLDKIVDLSLKLYVGDIDDKISALNLLVINGYRFLKEEHLEKAKRELKKLAEDTKLNYVMESYEDTREFDLSQLV